MLMEKKKKQLLLDEVVLFVKNIENYLFYLACLFIQII